MKAWIFVFNYTSCTSSEYFLGDVLVIIKNELASLEKIYIFKSEFVRRMKNFRLHCRYILQSNILWTDQAILKLLKFNVLHHRLVDRFEDDNISNEERKQEEKNLWRCRFAQRSKKEHLDVYKDDVAVTENGGERFRNNRIKNPNLKRMWKSKQEESVSRLWQVSIGS